ncbi:MAG TPA: protein translocase subunit SecD, partial [Pseudomonas sp.]|nr:protein translocase subunit SecD [Pseudomonas sp.]
MLNRFPLWKYLLILAVLAVAFVYSAPNLYPDDPAIQVTGASAAQEIGMADLERISQALEEGGIAVKSASLDEQGRGGLVRLERQDDQLPAKDIVRRTLGDAYVVAL